MRIVDDPTDRAALDAARAKFHEACAERDAIPGDERGVFDPELFEATKSIDGAMAGRRGRYIAAQAKVNEAFDAMDAADTGYYCLNVWGMRRCRKLMLNFNMVCGGDHPSWPKMGEYGITDESAAYDEMYLHREDPDDERVSPEVRAYLEAREAVASHHPEDKTGIPIFKFCSNDGWLVTEDECRQALEAFALTGVDASAVEYEDETVPWWPSWLNFLRLASVHGGFRVW